MWVVSERFGVWAHGVWRIVLLLPWRYVVGDRKTLESGAGSRSVRLGLAKCSRIVLLAAEGVANQEIAERVDALRTTVIVWRERYQAKDLHRLEDAPGAGRPRTADYAQIAAATLMPPPPTKLAVTHLSSCPLAMELKVSPATIARAWRAHGVQPWKAESFRLSTDPELWRVHLRERPQREAPRPYRRLEQARPPLRMDQVH